MPTYQYACTSCADELEVQQKFSDPALTECPACGGRLRKIFSAVGVVFKGSGFYKTDSRKPEPAATGAPAKDPSPAGEPAKGGDAGGKPAEATKSAEKPKPAEAAKASGRARSTAPA